jgi:hypothetical protein
MTENLDDFTLAFLEAALWSSIDDGGEPLDNEHSIADIDPGSLARMAEDCKRFQASAEWQAALAAEDDPRTALPRGYGCTLEQSAGADFWFTRCGHGAGFWDGDWQEPHGLALDALSKQFGNVDLYVGDDGKIYA